MISTLRMTAIILIGIVSLAMLIISLFMLLIIIASIIDEVK